MKKAIKFGKILLLIAVVFSQIASPITVLAEEILSMPLNVNLSEVYGEDKYLDHYELSYISLNNDYEAEKEYAIDLKTTFTYGNGETSIKNYDKILVDGETLNSRRSSYELDALSKYYSGTFKVSVTVTDEENTVLYEDDFSYDYHTLNGLCGTLGELNPTNETVSDLTNANYNVTIGQEYTQSLKVMPGQLSPESLYRVLVNDEVVVEEPITGEELRTLTLSGTVTDLTDKLGGEYTYTDTVLVEEVTLNPETSEYDTVNSYSYSYNTKILYDKNNDELFGSMYDALFTNGYLVVNAKGYENAETVLKIADLLSPLEGTETLVRVLDEEGNELDLTSEEVLASEVKNGYVVEFTNGAVATYTVVVYGDNTSDNTFNRDDLDKLLSQYLNEENVPSMDMYAKEEELPDGTYEDEEIGTLTFEDVVLTNELLKENSDTETERSDNTNLTLVFDNTEKEIYVGDSFEVSVYVNSDNIEDYIDGLDGLLSLSENLRLDGISFEDGTSLAYNEEGKLVLVGTEFKDGNTLMTLTLTATGEGDGTITLSGRTSKYLNINEFETVTKNVEIIRNISTNNNLSSLKANVGKFDVEFDKDVTVYNLTVPYDTKEVIISGGVEDSFASVSGLTLYELTEDKTTAIIEVTAEDGTVKTYTVYIIKEKPPVVSPVTYYYSSNNYLKELSASGYDIEFNRDTDEYRLTVGNDVTSLDIRAVAEDSRSRVEITGNEGFEVGENVVLIKVTAENGSTREYKLVVVKEEKQASPVTDTKDSSNNIEKIIIIILIVLVVLGLLYLIFKKDDDNDKPKYIKKENINSKGKKK